MNHLNLPPREVGSFGVETGNLIFHSLGNNCKYRYIGNKQITVTGLNEANLKRCLYDPLTTDTYKGLYPKVISQDKDTCTIRLVDRLPKDARNIIKTRQRSDKQAYPLKFEKAKDYIAQFAENHQHNQKEPKLTPFSDWLLKAGPEEFPFPFKDTKAEQYKFGIIFCSPSLRRHLHPELLVNLIADMVKNPEIWKDNFDIGREDLYDPQQMIYDRLQDDDSDALKKKIAETLQKVVP